MYRIILLSGKQGAMKTTIARRLQELRPESRIIKFADPLYEMHSAVYDCLARYGIKKPTKPDGLLLQLLGTDWGRASLGVDVWAHIAAARADAFISTTRGYIIIDDLRFGNEITAFDRSQTLLVRLECPEHIRKQRAEKWRDLTSHPSEVGLDHYQGWDLVFDTANPSHLEAICRKILSMCSLKVVPSTEKIQDPSTT